MVSLTGTNGKIGKYNKTLWVDINVLTEWPHVRWKLILVSLRPAGQMAYGMNSTKGPFDFFRSRL